MDICKCTIEVDRKKWQKEATRKLIIEFRSPQGKIKIATRDDKGNNAELRKRFPIRTVRG